MLTVDGIVMPAQPKEVLPALGADGIIHDDKDPAVRAVASRPTPGPELLAHRRQRPSPVAQEAVETGKVAVYEAGEDHLRDPQPAVEMREHEHEGTKVAVARAGKEGTERFEQNLPLGRRQHLRIPLGRVF